MVIKKLKEQNGSAASADFLISGTFFIFLVFGFVGFALAVVQVTQASHINNYYLDRARVNGGLSAEDVQNMITSFHNIDMDVINIDAPSVGTVKREVKIDNMTEIPEVWVKSEIAFHDNPFLLGLVLNSDQPGHIYMTGRAFTEFVGS